MTRTEPQRRADRGEPYTSDYADPWSRRRLHAFNTCGHYPVIGGVPCAACVDAAIQRAYLDGQRQARR